MPSRKTHKHPPRHTVRNSLSRRGFLKVAGIGAGAVLASCAAPTATAPTAVPPTAQPVVVEVTRIVAGTPVVEQVVVTATPQPVPETGETLRTLQVAFLGDPGTFDPGVEAPGGYLATRALLFEGLVRTTSAGEVVPGLAESWTQGADGLTWTFKLKPGLKWSNGDPHTAADFEYSIKRAMDPARVTNLGSFTASYSPTAKILNGNAFKQGEVTADEVGVRAIDDTTLEIVTEIPLNSLPRLLGASNFPYPVHAATVEAKGALYTLPGNLVSNGPFMLQSWVVGEEMVVVRNPHYTAHPVPLDRIVIKFYAETEEGSTTALLSYQAGELDAVRLLGAAIDSARGDATLSAEMRQINTTLQAPTMYWGHCSVPTPYDDPRVRRAVFMAIDTETICQEVLRGSAIGQHSIAPDTTPGFVPEYAVAFDLDAARTRLAEAGVSDPASLPPLTVHLGNPNPFMEAVAEQLQRNLGIVWNIDLTERAIYVVRRYELHPFPNLYVSGWGPPMAELSIFYGHDNGYLIESLPGEAWADYIAIRDDQTLDPADRQRQLTEIMLTRAPDYAKAGYDAALAASQEADPARQLAGFQEAMRLMEEASVWQGLANALQFYVVKPHVQNLDITGFRYGGIANYGDIDIA